MNAKQIGGLAGAGIAVLAVIALVVVLTGDDEPEPVPTPTPVETPTPTPTPEAEPFALQMDELTLNTTDHAPILSTEPVPVDEAAAHAAGEAAAEVLTAYLNAQFVDPQTRFSSGHWGRLLTPLALDMLPEEARPGLGELDLEVSHVITRGATAEPMVTLFGETPGEVTLTYTADFTIVLTDGDEVPGRQHGTLVFTPAEDTWLAFAVELSLDLDEDVPA